MPELVEIQLSFDACSYGSNDGDDTLVMKSWCIKCQSCVDMPKLSVLKTIDQDDDSTSGTFTNAHKVTIERRFYFCQLCVDMPSSMQLYIPRAFADKEKDKANRHLTGTYATVHIKDRRGKTRESVRLRELTPNPFSLIN